jgi:hypothetical protein
VYDKGVANNLERIPVQGAKSEVCKPTTCLGLSETHECWCRDTADWGISVKMNHYYWRLLFWQVDLCLVLHAMYCVIIFITRDNKDHPCHKYCSKNEGRERFQKDLAQELIAYAIHKDWRNVEDEMTKPAYMRKSLYVPCGCKMCFFCQEGLMHGVNH